MFFRFTARTVSNKVDFASNYDDAPKRASAKNSSRDHFTLRARLSPHAKSECTFKPVMPKPGFSLASFLLKSWALIQYGAADARPSVLANRILPAAEQRVLFEVHLETILEYKLLCGFLSLAKTITTKGVLQTRMDSKAGKTDQLQSHRHGAGCTNDLMGFFSLEH